MFGFLFVDENLELLQRSVVTLGVEFVSQERDAGSLLVTITFRNTVAQLYLCHCCFFTNIKLRQLFLFWLLTASFSVRAYPNSHRCHLSLGGGGRAAATATDARIR